MEIALLQHKGRPNLPFSPTWWLRHGKEVCQYLRPGLEAVTLAQRGGLSYTGSMSVWQRQLTSFSWLQICCKAFEERSLCRYQHTHFSCCNVGMLPVVCVYVRVFPPSNLVALGFLPEPEEKGRKLHSAAEVPSQGTCQAAWVGIWDPQVVCLISVGTNILSLSMLRIKPLLG